MRPGRLGALGALLAALAIAGCAGEGAEGRPWVRSVKIVGAHHVDVKDLESRIEVAGTSRIPFARKHYLDPFAVEIDRRRIEAYYQAHGFFGARVTKAAAFPRDGKSVDVVFVVEEGAPTKVVAARARGLDALGPKAIPLQNLFADQRGRIFDHARFLSSSAAVEARLKAAGFAWAKVDSGAEVDRDTREAQLHLDATLGPKVHVGKLVLQSNLGRVKTSRLLAHAGLHPGDLVTPQALEAARARLYNLGFFSSVKVSADSAPRDDATADVTFDARKGPLNELRIGAGVAIEFQRNEARVRAVWEKRSFFGDLRTLRLTIAPAYVAIPAVWNIARQGPAGTAEAVFTQPDLFSTFDRLRAVVGFDLGIDYAFQFYGPRGSLGYSRPLWKNRLLLGGSYNAQYLFFFNTDPTILEDPTQARLLFGFTDPYRLAWLEQDLVLDLRDRPLDPRRGTYFAVSGEVGGPYIGSAFQYQKVLPEARGYLPVGPRVVVVARAQFGQIWVQGDLGSPVTRRFRLGGPDSHRGFNYGRLSLQVPSGIPGVPAIPVGGDQMFLGQLEMRFNMFRLFGDWLELATFVDAGDVGAPSCPTSQPAQTAACPLLVGMPSTRVDWGDLYYATGAGLRAKTVVGIIRADLGVRLNRLSPFEPDGAANADPGSRFAFHLTIGEPF
jgi:translocation and assembly module TamA